VIRRTDIGANTYEKKKQTQTWHGRLNARLMTQFGADPANSQLCFQPPPVLVARMIPKTKATSPKPSIRWPWSKKRKGHLLVDQQPAESKAGTTASSSEAWRVEDPTSRGPSSSASGFRSTPAETPSSFFPNASNWVVNGLQINANQHGSNSNDLGELPVEMLSVPGRFI
jgi:hypothetical protein